MAELLNLTSSFSETEALGIVKVLYDLDGQVRLLPGEMDQNFHLIAKSGEAYVFKIANASASEPVLDFQNQAIAHLNQHLKADQLPRVIADADGNLMSSVEHNGMHHLVRLLTFVPGTFLADIDQHSPKLSKSFGVFLGRMNQVFESFNHPAAHRYLDWDMKHASYVIRKHLGKLQDDQRNIIETFLLRFETEVLPAFLELRTSVIHNDANDYNVLVDAHHQVSGIIDFGDMVHTYTICELSIGGAYAILNQENPLETMLEIVQGYHEVFPLEEQELDILFHLVCIRLCTSAAIAAHGLQQRPDDEYLQISQKPVWKALEQLIDLNPLVVTNKLKQVCGVETSSGLVSENILELREKHLNHNLSVAYQKPLKIVRGKGQYLYDEFGKDYLDMVNNVCHVGHCHPKVVAAGQRQMAMLNTNTRYLHDHIVEFAQRLCDTMPDSLSVCTFVCSGSEANDLALRMAKAYTGGTDVVVVDGAYHGHLSSIIDVSPYKFNQRGGAGKPDNVHITPMPDPYRGLYRHDDPEAGAKYAQHVNEAVDQIKAQGQKLNAYYCESIQGVGGQIVMPDGYLKAAYQHVRDVGGVCIADEVQVGMGRVGSHFWAFETQGAVPDIVTIGKPLGNGHPVAAVVTTPEIAAAFNNGMEYFNTFGGNPVSCAIGLAVLDVIVQEGLQQNALEVGNYLMDELRSLQQKQSLIGDVRGLGLFIGVELVLDRQSLEPATKQANAISEWMKDQGVLVTTEGPLGNVLKIKPPIVFDRANVDFFVRKLDEMLRQLAG